MNAVAQKEQGTPTRAKNFVSPEVNVFETNVGFVLEAEMPGVNKEGLEVTLEGNELTIIGHRAEETVHGSVIYRESRPADFRRTFELDASIDTGAISAKIDQGLLTLTLPKHEKVKPRKITIES